MSRIRMRLLTIFITVAALLISSMTFLLTPANAAVTITVNATQRYQAVQALGVNANVHSWNNGQLAPALDLLTSQMGANAFRVVIDNADWESTNDDQDPAHFNWEYYNTVYESPKFTDLWKTIAYLNTKGATVSLNVMGPLAGWMGGQSLSVSQEDEWVEMMASLVYYGRVVKNLSFTLFEPFNESDLSGIEGALASADQVARVMHQLGLRLDALGLQDVKFILPDTAATNAGVGPYFSAMLTDPYLMGKVPVLGLHSYFGETGNANSTIKASPYPELPFWMTEFSAVCDGCNTGAPNPSNWPYARTTADYLMDHLREYAAGAEVWEGYDSYYEHHASWSYWGLLSYDQASGTYSPRKAFYAMAQFMRFIPAGSVRIGASSGGSNVPLLAFHDPVSGRVTVVGFNTSSSGETLNGTITGIPGLSAMAYYRTNANANMEAMGDVTVSGGTFSVDVAGDTLFTLTGVAGPDDTAPTVKLTSPVSGATVTGVTELAATADDNRGVARVEFAVDGTVVGSDTQAPFQVTWDARTVVPGPHTISARAFDAAGNSTADSVDVTVIVDTTPPSIPTGLTASPSSTQVTLAWQPSTDNIEVAGYDVLRDGADIGTAATNSYVDTSVLAAHTYSYSVKARDTSGNLSAASTPVTVTTSSQAPLTVDKIVTTHQTTAAAAISSPVFSTTSPDELLVAFAASDGPGNSAQTFRTVTGGGLTWQLRQRANVQAGTAEIWTATAASALTNAQVTATRSNGSYLGSLTVVAFSGADTATNGAAASASAASGPPTVRLTTTRAGSWVWAAGDDWDRAIARTVPSGQTLVDQFLASVGDTFWVQRLDSPTPSAGTTVTINDTAPTTDRWNLAAIEILPSSAPAPDTTAPAVSVTTPADGATVTGSIPVTAAASDDVGVAKVEFSVDGTLAATDTTSPYSFTWDSTTAAEGAHQLTAKAYDAAGNSATDSIAVTVRNADVTAPSAPTGLSATATGPSAAHLTWTASSDNVGVTGYAVIRDGQQVGTTAATSYNDSSLQPATSYTYTVTASDAAGNVSPPSSPTTVTTPAEPPADTTPPTVAVTAPAADTTVSGAVTVTASASDDVGVAKVEFSVDGTLAATDTTSPYSFTWDSTTAAEGAHQLTAKAYDAAGNSATDSIAVTVRNAVPLSIDVSVTTHQSRASGSITSRAFSTTRADDLLVALIASDGSSKQTQTIRSVTGGGLTWQLRQRANGQTGTAEIWTAVAPSIVTNIQVTATRGRGSYQGSITVVAFSGADTAANGAAAGASGASGAPSVSLTTTRAGSWVWAIGNDSSQAIERTAPSGQTLVDQFLSGGDTFWVQRLNSATPSAGTSVTITDTAPTTDRWNLAAIEIRAR